MKCNQIASFKYWWTDKWAYACIEHMIGIQGVAQVIGHSFPVVQLTVGDGIHECESEIGKKEND